MTSRSSWSAVVLAAWILLSTSVACAQETMEREGARVSFVGIEQEYAEAIARTVAAARRTAIDQFGFDMPATITVNVSVEPKTTVRLFNDGQDRFSLTVRSQADLRKPSESGIFHLYGLCHEVGHLAMYRPIQNRTWLSSVAAESWAHYLGSRIVDELYDREGGDLWPDVYDYRSDGMRRLDQQLASVNPSDLAQGAGLWKELIEIAGDRSVASVFAAWGQTQIDPANPAEALGRALAASTDNPRIGDWWNRAHEVFVVQRATSEFVAHKSPPDTLGTPQELAHDDGQQAGKSSIAGGAHAVRFEVPDDSFSLTSVRIYGSRYGYPQAPREEFHVWLCDKEFRSIADFPFAYAKFERGSARWVTLEVEPTKVPREFFICVGFNPTATKGVFLGYDGKAGETSFVGLPGSPANRFEKGSWMVRASVAQGATTRMWQDSTGKFRVEAELLEVAEGQAHLKRKDGTVIEVPIERLSAADQEFLRSRTETPPASENATVMLSRLSGEPVELKTDDGRPAGKKSFPRGFAVAFESPGSGYYLTGIRIHGGRYGSSRAPREDFHVTLCDEAFGQIEDFAFDYSKFQRADPKWVALRVKPTKLPPKFVICVNFAATGAKGVYVSHDADGRALVGLPGKPAGTFSGGDWLIRVSVDQLAKP